ncbi:adenosylcobalamin-dependent ribonucleoside-diphosphate reductase, partial [Candidatus Woesearchaeota archaeon]|nr:adenosylcobalamin-dependent ribonucleoside-diphosphate reductase [Candidatus Woesearchaeota archaeon]
ASSRALSNCFSCLESANKAIRILLSCFALRSSKFFDIDFKTTKQYGHPISLWNGNQILHTKNERAILAGEAACIVDPLTAEGIKPIENIREGELVLTASGKFRKVVKTMERFSESYRVINIWKMPKETLTVTDDHPILCLNKETKKSQWKFASEITSEDHVALSYPKQTNDKDKLNVIDYLEKNKYIIKGGYIIKPNKDKNYPKYSIQTKPIKAEIDIDYDLLKIFGYYLSEGDIDKDNAVRFTFNSSEIEYMQDLILLMERKFGVKAKIEKSNFGNWSNLRFFSRILVKLFKFILGEGFNKKIIPYWLLELPIEKQKGLLVGIIRGDGFPTKNRHTTNIRAVLSNKNMVYGIWTILARLGYLATFRKESPKKLATTDSYISSLDSCNSEKIFDEVFIGREFYGITQASMRRVKELFVEGVFYLPVRNIKVIQESIKVYNFEVEGEHTYVANNVAVHNCFVLPVGDSIEEIYYALTAMAMIHQTGGGTGFSFSRIRPEGDPVQSTKGVASGPMSFMRIFDTSTEVVKQGGSRRGANMGIMYYKHPDIKKFITAKSKDRGFLQNFNISVALDEDFMKAVENNSEVELLNPKTKKLVTIEKAKELFDLMAQCAWETGDPGFVVIDRINNTNSNPTPKIGQIESTNPCGEQPLLPWEPCTLGSINLSNHVKKLEGKYVVDYTKLEYTTKLATHFLDNVIDMGNYPLSEIEYISKGNRRIGLGVMGWAEMLAKLQIPYDSEEAITLAEEIMGFINLKSLEASEELAETRGVFYNFKDSIYDEKSSYFRGQLSRPRNCARTTIAPTGTIAITAGLQGSGIEPFFAIVYRRYQAEAVDALKKGEEPDPRYVYYEVVPLFLEVAEKHNWFGLDKNTLLKKIADNHSSVRGIKEIPTNIQKIFVSSHDINWKTHIDHQAAFQKHVDNAVSKTINMSNSVTVEDIKEAYLYAYKAGCKGVTVYRDGCKEVQVLNLSSTEASKKQKEEKKEIDFSKGISSDYYEIETGYGPLHVNVIYDKEGPQRIFTSIPPIGTELSSLTSALGVFMSKAFQAGYDPHKAIKHLNSAKGDRPYGFGPNRIDSIPHGVAIALKRHLEKTGRIGDKEQRRLTEHVEVKQQHCTKCYSPNVEYINGCPSPTCLDCGHSECS